MQEEEIYMEISAGLFNRRQMQTHFLSDRFIQHFSFMLPRRHDLSEGLAVEWLMPNLPTAAAALLPNLVKKAFLILFKRFL